MQAPAQPVDEAFRLQALRSLALLDTRPEPAFEAIVALGCRLFDVPTCLISLVDENRQWLKARVGLSEQETSRDVSFCGHAILLKEPLVILDTHQDERFADNPLVTGEPRIRFYAGCPLWLPNGYCIGTVCLISPQPRLAVAAHEITTLKQLGVMAMTAITARAVRQEADHALHRLDRLETLFHLAPQPMAFTDQQGQVVMANPAFTQLHADGLLDGWQLPGRLRIPDEVLAMPTLLTWGEVEQNLPMGGKLSIARDFDGFLITGYRGG